MQSNWKSIILHKSKLRTYRLIKDNVCKELYLDNSVTPIKSKLNKELLIGTYIMTMLRSGTNELAIEIDRRNLTPINKRFCRYCKANHIVINEHQMNMFNLPYNRKVVIDNNYREYGDANIYGNVEVNSIPIEDEFHFILDCKAYAEQRQLLYEQILSISNKKVDLYSMASRVQRMKIILGNTNIYKQLSIYLSKEIIMKIIDKCKLFCFHCMKIRNNFNYKSINEQNNVSTCMEESDYNNINNDNFNNINDVDVINDYDIDINEYMNEIENIICS